MLSPKLQQSPKSASNLALLRPQIPGQGRPPASLPLRSAWPRQAGKNVSLYSVSNNVKASLLSHDKSASIKAVVTAKPIERNLLSSLSPGGQLDCISTLCGKSLLLELVAAEVDSKTGAEKETIKAYARLKSRKKDEVKFEAEFKVKDGFGEVGAVLVQNELRKEIYLEEIILTGSASETVTISCNSWVAARNDSREKRIFFTNKSYLPSQTPSGLKELREKELENLRGNGEGERKSFERIYDYDVYNDLGNPDLSDKLKRPVLGGKEIPYPRRCRTGRRKSKKDPESETFSLSPYVPRDEQFMEVKQKGAGATSVSTLAKTFLQTLNALFIEQNLSFPFFTDIDKLFNEGLTLDTHTVPKGIYKLLLPRLVKAAQEKGKEVLLFEPPAMMERDKFSWLRDEEFARQTLAGLNPLSIQLVTEFPFVSKLDPRIYGPPESAITKDIIECQIKGYMTMEEALERKRLFMLDYHDLFLPYVNTVRNLPGTTLYASRTIFFLTNDGTLRPLAIELTRPASPTKPQWKRVFTPGFDSTDTWLWMFAKAHVRAHDMGYHELVSHWLRTHACVEPYIVAANRQLSAMHPIYRLLHPHFRYTMMINSLARLLLISADGIIEMSFFPKKSSMQLCAAVYDQVWRFDKEGLPADLIGRGMAVEDPKAEHGLKLTIEDYPFAADGLLIWSAIQQWVSDYVAHFYPHDNMVSSDTELQAWWSEVRTKGHGDKQDEPWWPTLNTPEDLTHVLTTIIWVTSCHHAAVNFGQYHYAGYFPNHPSIMRRNMPNEDESPENFKRFWETPEREFVEGLPSQFQATLVMAILDVLSSHSEDEEYLGESPVLAWTENRAISAAFDKFRARMKEIEGIIGQRNTDRKLRNRTGAGIIPYELLKPFSKPGVTGRGVPNSISI